MVGYWRCWRFRFITLGRQVGVWWVEWLNHEDVMKVARLGIMPTYTCGFGVYC
jgi:hypothetical protein